MILYYAAFYFFVFCFLRFSLLTYAFTIWYWEKSNTSDPRIQRP